ncbi:MAG: hypothetical protein Q9164_001801 [Protoblastenia rupestris]
MSRRAPPNAAQERAAQNQQTIKTLLKLEGNKSCADCKRNKHPRWASWNLGVFVCIRCSGIHRGMGTHISRVKSVDLDAWTDEQLQSILRWGNSRANKYWESKLAPGHVPSEAKIENFIRTKYESKRWVMEGPMPDPATLDTEGDDDVPLNVVQEKAKLDRASSQSNSSTSVQPVPPPPKPAPQLDLFGDVPAPPARPNTTDTPGARPPPPKSSAESKPAKAADSLLGLDFFGGPPSSSSRPSSSASIPTGTAVPSRPDLKQSILSLYASAPKQQPAPQHERQGSFGGLQSPPAQQQPKGGLDDAFGNLNFNPPTKPPSKPPPKTSTDPFASFNSSATQRSSVAAPQITSPPLSGGGFFDAGPKLASKPAIASRAPQKPQANLPSLDSNDFGDFNFASDSSTVPSEPATATISNDLFDMAEPPPAPAPQKAPAPAPTSTFNSPFNLSTPAPTIQAPSKPASTTQNNSSSNFAGLSNSDAWGSNDAWSTPDPTTPVEAPKPKSAPASKPPTIPMTNDFSAWGSSDPATDQSSSVGNGFGSTPQAPPRITPDEDFGGWSSAAPVAPAKSNPPPPQSKPAGGGFGGDDLFSNVWE